MIFPIPQSRTDYCEGISTDPSKDLQQLMHSTLNHQWQTAVDQGKLTEIPSTLMMSGSLEGALYIGVHCASQIYLKPTIQ